MSMKRKGKIALKNLKISVYAYNSLKIATIKGFKVIRYNYFTSEHRCWFAPLRMFSKIFNFQCFESFTSKENNYVAGMSIM